ncbi:malto-oligosyltrehalose synthase [Sinomonas susongensis]|uniref:malto-oligosyltrehalose synthase n=1 Tax=Sinomonas susongensis TaxID=1324851 RepID=UPI00110943D8|nr:malto-oligosyltrehalose synthase [Sinomonas susongensis]
MRYPSSTYRLQIRPGFTLDDAARLVPYLRRLGVGWVYLSPILAAVRGSEHGYDVADPTRVDPERGGEEGLARLAAAAHEADMGVLVDIVPNHLGIDVPEQNPWWWSLLREGRNSRFAEAFDVDWAAGDGKVLLPLLGSEADLDTLRLEGDRLYLGEMALPVAEGSVREGDTPRDVAERQNYELIPWREGETRLNYRRFFTVTSLAGVRVEVPWVFHAAHAEVRRWFEEGLADGLRIDHPDGLADPVEYLGRLRELTGNSYTVIEKILEADERLPSVFPCEGTTGYDALGVVDRLFVDPAGEGRLNELDAALRRRNDAEGAGADAGGAGYDVDTQARIAKRMITAGPLRAEILRLARLVPAAADAHGLVEAGALPAPLASPDEVADSIAEIAVAYPVYRTYLPHIPGEADLVRGACKEAADERPDLAETITVLESLLTDPATELCIRFQQTTGMIMAKGVEDTAFYRLSRLGTLTEVGTDPGRFAVSLDEFHARMGEREASIPLSMTTLTTHDTKRSEDARARISVLAEVAEEWSQLLPRLLERAELPDGSLANLVWQAIVGAWPADVERLTGYALKAAREGALHTTWTDPNSEFEGQLEALVRSAVSDDETRNLVEDFVAGIEPYAASNGLSAKLVQLAGPGVPDVYQGTEFWDRSLTDPDNRRPVDFEARDAALAGLDAAAAVPAPTAQEAKLLVVSRTLRLRRDRPELFEGYVPLEATGPAAEHAVGFRRGARGAVVLATRLPRGLEQRGGWGDTSVVLPWPARNAFTGAVHEAGRLPLAEVLAELPVALLVPEED